MTRRFGWLIVAALAPVAIVGASIVRADETAKDKPADKPAEKPVDKKDTKVAADAKPETKPDDDAKAKADAAKAKADAAKSAAAEKKDADELLALTNDPLLGKADRISGEELTGMVAFTFDDGPNPDTTPDVIAALKKYDIPATFFIVTQRISGKSGDKARDVLQKEIAGGFGIASHSVTHPVLRGKGDDVFAREIDGSIRTLAKEAGRTIGLFRAPYGAIDANGRAWLHKRGLTEVFWSIDTLDWKAKDEDKLRHVVMKMILDQQGGIVLMHDVKPITAAVIPKILDDLEAENCKRLADKKDPIWPVSIHYFLRDKKKPRAIPPDVQKRTDAYKAALPKRCAARPAPPPQVKENPRPKHDEK